jgi:radical SAM-linked protein
MRDVINKGLTNEELLRGIKTAVEQGWDKVKLYFMIGLPGETDADVLGIAETVFWLRRECRLPGRKRLDFNLTISNFTPKPHTPFQWHSVSTAEFTRKQKLLKDAFAKAGGIRVNYTDVRISAMEDFLGRGDRRLAPVIRRAWELGAGMDAWWENTNKAFAAWANAIEESELTWKYRQIENGEWNLFQASEGNSLDAPLPWDHINTGIDKQWLKADLQRALEAITVPDCSFDGCSHCGVCGVDFGHNIVVPAPPIPAFAGNFQPNQDKVQRLRVWFGKLGDMALVSHLDLVRLFDRVVRRAAIPISFTGGFHPGPRIAIANALSLGVTSSGEIVDFELSKRVDVNEFQEKLAEQLPPDLPVYKVEEVDIKSPSATRLLYKAAYLLTFANQGMGLEQWQGWIETINNSREIFWDKISKSGKLDKVNLRDRLFSLSLENYQKDTVTLHYIGSCRNDGTLLTPEHLIYMLDNVAQESFDLLKAHRQEMWLESDGAQ